MRTQSDITELSSTFVSVSETVEEPERFVNEPGGGHEDRLQALSAVTLLYTVTKLLLPSQLELLLHC